MDSLVQPRFHPGLLTELVDGFARERFGRIGAWEQPGAGLIALPILPYEIEQAWGEHHTAILLAFPLPDAQDHAGPVDIRDLEVPECRDPQAGGRDGGQDGAGFETTGGLE